MFLNRMRILWVFALFITINNAIGQLGGSHPRRTGVPVSPCREYLQLPTTDAEGSGPYPSARAHQNQ